MAEVSQEEVVRLLHRVLTEIRVVGNTALEIGHRVAVIHERETEITEAAVAAASGAPEPNSPQHPHPTQEDLLTRLHSIINNLTDHIQGLNQRLDMWFEPPPPPPTLLQRLGGRLVALGERMSSPPARYVYRVASDSQGPGSLGNLGSPG